MLTPRPLAVVLILAVSACIPAERTLPPTLGSARAAPAFADGDLLHEAMLPADLPCFDEDELARWRTPHTRVELPVHVVVLTPEDAAPRPRPPTEAWVDARLEEVNHELRSVGLELNRTAPTVEHASAAWRFDGSRVDLRATWQPLTSPIGLTIILHESMTVDGVAVQGLTDFPWTGDPAHNALSLDMEANLKTWMHLLGHRLGLLHTDAGLFSQEDCSTTGDRICDTPPDPGRCSSSNDGACCVLEDCGEPPVCFTHADGPVAQTYGPPDHRNAMSRWPCPGDFTSDQTARMHCEIGHGAVPGVDGATLCQDLDGDGYGVGPECIAEDCDDTRGEVNPAATERCDHGDNDCDGDVDEDQGVQWLRDADGDGVGGSELGPLDCTWTDPPGFTLVAGDCDDLVTTVHPGATERCDGVDEDCDGQIDQGLDRDVDGVSQCEGDCDDQNALVFPGATEACDAAEDYNCDGTLTPCPPVCQDADGDGRGVNCQGGPDCDDRDATRFPGAPEACDGVDQDCDGLADEGVTPTWYPDADLDSFGDANAAPIFACSQPDSTTTLDHGDCDDTEPGVHPLAAETCNGRDDNCDGQPDPACGVRLATADLSAHQTTDTVTLPLPEHTREWLAFFAFPQVVDAPAACTWDTSFVQVGDGVSFSLHTHGCGVAPDGSLTRATAVLLSHTGDAGWMSHAIVDGGIDPQGVSVLPVPAAVTQRQTVHTCEWSRWFADPEDGRGRRCETTPSWGVGEVFVEASSGPDTCETDGISFGARGVAFGLSDNLVAEVLPATCTPGQPAVVSHRYAPGPDRQVLVMPRSVEPSTCGEPVSWWTDCSEGPWSVDCTLYCLGAATTADILFIDGDFGY